MRIALLGTHGIPAAYGGFETCAEQLSVRLAKRGHEVSVYCRIPHVQWPSEIYRGVNLVKLPAPRNKYLETPIHTWISTAHLLSRPCDAALYFIAGNSPLTWLPRLVGIKTMLNVDGLDWKREKWPLFAKIYIQLCEYLATKLPTLFLTDSPVVQAYYQERFGVVPPWIPYGSEVAMKPPGPLVEKYGLEPGRYVLFVGRLVPENCAHHLVEAFRHIDTDYKCVIVGDASYADDYIRDLKKKGRSDSRIIFTGYVFGEGYSELSTSAGVFVETSGVGGTHPALVEAMGFGSCVIVHDTRENLQVIGTAGLSYSGKEGAASLRGVLSDVLSSAKKQATLGDAARHRARQEYDWEKVTDAYEALLLGLTVV